MSEVVDTYAYCLLGNHFHLLIKVKDIETLKKLHPNVENVHEIISARLKRFFQSYAMSFNKQESRVGTLFQTPYKRSLITSNDYFENMVYYIHANPQKHGLIDDFKRYEWSSYNRILIDKPSKLHKQEVIAWFGNKENYKEAHQTYIEKPIPPDFDLDQE